VFDIVKAKRYEDDGLESGGGNTWCLRSGGAYRVLSSRVKTPWSDLYWLYLAIVVLTIILLLKALHGIFSDPLSRVKT
jgi:hypothetical protein